MSRVITFLTITLVLSFSATAFDVPAKVSFQGQLNDSNGDPVADGTYELDLRFYASSSSPTVEYSVWDHQVTTINGKFTTMIPLDKSYFNGQSKWMGISVGADPELTPRIEFASVPYAFRSDYSDTSSYANASLQWTSNGNDVKLTNANSNIGIGREPDATAKIAITDPGGMTGFVNIFKTSITPYLIQATTIDVANGAIYGGAPNTAIQGVSDYGPAVVGSSREGSGGKFSGIGDYGVQGECSLSGITSRGYLGYFEHGAYGYNLDNDSKGYLGSPDAGVRGISNPADLENDYPAVEGHSYGSGTIGRLGVWYSGVRGEGNSADEFGVTGINTLGQTGHLGAYDYGVFGQAAELYKSGVYGINDYRGCYGMLGNDWQGVYGNSPVGGGDAVLGENDNYNTLGALGSGSYAVFGWNKGASTNYAGYFDGNVSIYGTLSKSSGSFKIDHPKDPANKWLYHSFVESPDMMNIYNGNITTDANGFATVKMPDYFDALNKDFRYQLTVIGSFARAIIAEEISGNSFLIQTDEPNIKVSWQVTGVRNDHYAKENRIPVEVDKTSLERGKYAHPELFGFDKNYSVNSNLYQKYSNQKKQ